MPPGGLGGGLANPWPFGYGSAAAAGLGSEGYRVLTTCSWEQSDTMVKVYVPLRGVQTDMLRTTFTPTSVEVRASLLRRLPNDLLRSFLAQGCNICSIADSCMYCYLPGSYTRHTGCKWPQVSAHLCLDVLPRCAYIGAEGMCPAAAQVKVHDLHGKNYMFTLSPTFLPIAEDGCVAVASKTRKNILITMQVDLSHLLPAYVKVCTPIEHGTVFSGLS